MLQKPTKLLANMEYEFWFFHPPVLVCSNMSAIYKYLGAEESEIPIYGFGGPLD
jgi:hypothetical protein